jgi:hypothetical protein
LENEEIDYETAFGGEAVGVHPTDDGYSKLTISVEENWLGMLETSLIDTFGASFHINYARTQNTHEVGWIKYVDNGLYFVIQDRKREYFYAPCPPLFPKLNMEMLTNFCHNILLNNKITPKSATKEAVIESVGEDLIRKYGIVKRAGLNIRRRGSLGCNMVLDISDGLGMEIDGVLTADEFDRDLHLPELAKNNLLENWQFELLRTNEKFKKSGDILVLCDSNYWIAGWSAIYHLRADMCAMIFKTEQDYSKSLDRDIIVASCFLAKEKGYNRINIGTPEDKEKLKYWSLLKFKPMKTVDLTSAPKKKASAKSKKLNQKPYKEVLERLDW